MYPSTSMIVRDTTLVVKTLVVKTLVVKTLAQA